MKGNNSQSYNTSHQNDEIIMQPPLYFAEEHVWNVCFHPCSDIIACSQITGQIQVLSYNSDDVKPLIQNKQLHKSSARFCTFNPSGNLLATCSEDKRLGFLNGNGQIAHIIKKAHPSPINRCHFINDQVLASGDDDGMIKVWDLRTAVPVFQAQEQGQAITGFAFDSSISQYQLYTSCLNGTVAAYDMRQVSDNNAKLLCLSDSIDEQLNGISLIKNGGYVVCPSSQGSIVIYKRDQLEHHIDRIQGQPGSVDAILKIDESTIITGSEDGFIRGVSILPNKILQVLGQHEQQQNFPIQSLSLSHCRRFAASSSHDNSIKFYDVNDFVRNRLLAKDGIQEQIKIQGQHLARQQSENSSAMNWQAQNQQQNSEDFESDSDDDQDSDSQQLNQKKKKKKNKKLSIKARQKQLKKNNVKSFFKGL